VVALVALVALVAVPTVIPDNDDAPVPPEATGKPAPKEESVGQKFSLYGHDYMAGNYQATDTISLTNYDLKPLTASDLSFFKS